MKNRGAIIRASLFISLLIIVYGMSEYKHQERQQIRDTEVQLVPECQKKLAEYNLHAGEYYISPYITTQTNNETPLEGYSLADVRSIQRGCNIAADYHGWAAVNGDADRWNSARYARTKTMNCLNCHRQVGDWKDEQGQHIEGSMGFAVNWTNSGDQYDSYTGLILMPELRFMQCGINSMNGFKPNVLDDLIRDFIAYSRFLAAATGKTMGVRYAEQGAKNIPPSLTQKHGDDFTVGRTLYFQKCVKCHGEDGRGGRVEGDPRIPYGIVPPLAGPDSFNTDSRNYFATGVYAGIIQVNMPLGEEGSLTNDEARHLVKYIQTLPRPAGDMKGVLAAVRNQVLMHSVPELLELFGNEQNQP